MLNAAYIGNHCQLLLFEIHFMSEAYLKRINYRCSSGQIQVHLRIEGQRRVIGSSSTQLAPHENLFNIPIIIRPSPELPRGRIISRLDSRLPGPITQVCFRLPLFYVVSPGPDFGSVCVASVSQREDFS